MVCTEDLANKGYQVRSKSRLQVSIVLIAHKHRLDYVNSAKYVPMHRRPHQQPQQVGIIDYVGKANQEDIYI